MEDLDLADDITSFADAFEIVAALRKLRSDTVL